MVYGLAAAMPNPSPLLRSDQSKPGIVAYAGPLLDFPAGDGVCRRRRDFVFVVNPRGANGAAGREWERLLPQIEARLGNECNICESITSGPLHAVDVTRQAIKEGAEAVIAVGGDGTLHEVVNGFFEAGEPLLDRKQNQYHPTTLGLIPLGTGSDFARTFGWKNNLHEAIDRIAKGKRCKLDVGVISGGGGEPHYFINVADLHLSAKAGYYASKYKRFGNFCYILGSLRAFVGHSNQDLRIKINGGDWEILDKVTAVCFGNGKFFGGGMKISPKADPCSGKLEAVILQDFKWYDFLLKLHKLYRGTHLSERNVCSRSVHSVEIEEIEHTGSMYIQADGEHLGFLPRKISILPGVMQMFC